jgi:hypothetical protein
MSLTFALIKERKSPPDKRVVLTPEQGVLFKSQFPEARLVVESSDIRIFSDEQYRALGIEVLEDVSFADVFVGVKEVPIASLIEEKAYFFFSHTIKKQPYNQGLLQAICTKKIALYDHETFVSDSGSRLIGFGRYAGIVGAYNGFRLFGQKMKTFDLPKVEHLYDYNAVKEALQNVVLPENFKTLITGRGKVALGAKEIIDHLKINQVSPSELLQEKQLGPSYAMLDLEDYNKHGEGKDFDRSEFYQFPERYAGNFDRFTQVIDMFVAGHFYGSGAPIILTREALRDPRCRIKVVADVSCDIDGPVACTLRPSTIAEPFYGYHAQSHTEVDFKEVNAVGVMAVDNLPCELPRDASHGFGEQFLAQIAPSFFDGDAGGILSRAQITDSMGRLTPRFQYLQNYVMGH